MTVIEAGGGWLVVDGDATLAGPFSTNAEAWRAVDRLEGSPISPAEKRADWIASKILSAGLAPTRVETKPKSKKGKRQAKRMKRAAAKAPKWLRTGAAATFDPQGNRAYREWQLGTFGAASPVRRVDPAEYLKGKA
ncbi:MAG: hypothetical protein E5X72_00030 [Mesorhizobium sp.]|uniref:hypothetical protein n=1 Tax=Mesorhizobium sp. TaxID=1871066 RepID=UPI00121FBC44|nr:hypothetical protein [Mesorhizobium sp.]TIP06638.1 MAG: hypothetical protein E5X72_00030 [Mesorhizobium sp.]